MGHVDRGADGGGRSVNGWFTRMKRVRTAVLAALFSVFPLLPGEAGDDDFVGQLRKADSLIKRQRYADARDACEVVLLQDPYRREAIARLRLIHRRLLALAAERETKGDPRFSPFGSRITDTTPKRVERRLGELGELMIPEFALEETDLRTAFDRLCSAANPLYRDGTRLRIDLQQTPAESRPAPLDVGKIAVEEVVDYLCFLYELDYHLENGVVVVQPAPTAVKFSP